jgi:putative ABC transport system permease protein
MINLKIAVRKLLKTKVYTLSNLVGLTLMFSVSLIIFSFVYYHFQFDKDVQDREKIYRIITRIKGGTYWAATFGAFDLALKDLPEIESKASFYMDETSHSIYDGEKEFSIANPIYADSEFLNFFNIKILAGTSFEIDEPNTAMIPSTLATKIFGNDNPIGKSISLSIDDENKRMYKVAGIVDGMEQSHIQFDIILSLKGYFEGTHDFLQKSKVFGANIYLNLVNTNKASELQEKLPSIVSPFLENAHGPPVEAFDIELQPLTDIHFTPGFNRDVTTAVSRSDLNILLIVGLLIFLTATFNFLFMNVVYTEDRMKQLQIVSILEVLSLVF